MRVLLVEDEERLAEAIASGLAAEAATIAAAVDHHDQRFGIGLDSSEKAALVAFLSAL
ncbi:hypothetical protein [Sorangium sp. So ce131]|uniref:hypothetical protein n=1 Tax=Sorangium sp. So ce131 TaxID=3133282 RepID=UPI003F5FDB63